MTRVLTPTAAAPASIGPRVGAYAIDAAIGGALTCLVAVVAAAVAFSSGAPSSPVELMARASVVWVAVAGVGLAWAVVYTALQGGRGSIGQRAAGIRIADAETSAPIGFGRALLRNVVFGLAASIVVGCFTPLFDGSGRRQGWHDSAARALVVRRVAAETAAAPPAARAVPASSEPSARAVAASPEASAVAAPLFGTPIPPPSIVAPPTRFAASSSPVGDAVISFVPGVGPGSAARVTAPPASAGSALADVPAASSTSPAAASSASATRVGSVLPPAPARSVAPPAPARSVPSVSPAIPAAAPPAPATPAAASVTPAAASATPVASSAASVTPVASSAASATPVASSAPSARPADTDGETLLRAPRPLAVLALRWDDGTRVGVYGRTLFGRNPAPDEGATTIAVRDETLSLSKTHFEIGGDAASGAWVVDRHSTNGTVLVRGGVRSPLAPGARTPLQAGDRLEMGDRSVEVGDPS